METNNYYDIYISQVLELAKTIVIKSEVSAKGINQYLMDYYGSSSVNSLAPRTWKYYLNLAGEYHPADTRMYVISMDTLEEILFSKENLAIHTTTAEYYQYGKNKYKELIKTYPDQEMLVLGILNPVDIDKAIAAADGQILMYSNTLVEKNEYTFISRLQSWINAYSYFWVNGAYGISDSLYYAVSHATLYLNLIPAILNIRLELCKTNEVHSFHRKQYLASHGYLDTYIDEMTLEQSLFLYRNILYIDRNAGKQETFDWLVDNILTKRGIPLSEYKMKHSLGNMPTNLYPDVTYKKKTFNLSDPASDSIIQTTNLLLTKEDDYAKDNLTNHAYYLNKTIEQMENSISSTVQTKILESSMIDNSDSTPYTLADALTNHWAYLASTGMYKTYIALDNPRTGETIELSVKDAYVLSWYALCRQANITLTNVPVFKVSRIQRNPIPTVNDLMSVVNAKYINRSIANTLVTKQPIIQKLITTSSFYTLCEKINQVQQYHRFLIASTEHAVARGMIDNMVSRLYADGFVDLSDGHVTFDDWLLAKKINIDNFLPEDFKTIYDYIVTYAVGLNFHKTTSIQDIQKAMIGLMKDLSSYSIQFLSEINADAIKKFDFASIRVGDVIESPIDVGLGLDVDVGVIRSASTYQEVFMFELGQTLISNIKQKEINRAGYTDIGVNITHSHIVKNTGSFVTNSLDVKLTNDPSNINLLTQDQLIKIGSLFKN